MCRPEFCFPLLSLPALPLVAVIQFLERKDRLALASTCRRLARIVSEASTVSLTVQSSTGWKGLCQIFATSIVNCNEFALMAEEPCNEQPTDNNALHMLVKPEPVFNCLFSGIKKVYIYKVHSLPCLLPPNLARILPNLEDLSLWASRQDTDVLPLPYCTSLRRLTYAHDCDIQLMPGKHHTVEELQRQLPCIDTLTLWQDPGDSMDSITRAWGNHLTSIKLSFNGVSQVKLQHCAVLQSLILQSWAKEGPLNVLPSSLNELTLRFLMREADLSVILQLPRLRVVCIQGFVNSLRQDWSTHSCTWRQLSFSKLHVMDLSKLPLQSLQGPVCLNIKELELPNPLLPNNLAAVLQAVQCVSNAGVTIEGDAWSCAVWDSPPENPTTDAASAELLRAACSVVHKNYHSFAFSDVALAQYPQTTTALIHWASPVVHEIRILTDAVTMPWFWQALQCCHNLKTVDFDWYNKAYQCMDIVSIQAQLAGEHFVAVTRRPIELKFVIEKESEQVQAAVAELEQMLPQKMPGSVSMLYCTWRELIFHSTPTCLVSVCLSPQ